MFNKPSAQAEKPQAAETVIGPSIKVKGNFHGDGNMVIEGSVEGSVKTSGELFIGDKARVSANLEAKEARIGGEIIGNIKVKGYLNIASSARLAGDISAGSISVEKGAVLNGRINIGAEVKGGDGVRQEPK